MSQLGRWLMGALGGAVVLFAAGPRTRVRLDGAKPQVPSTPGEVAPWIEKREAAVDGVVPGAEARIVWGSEVKQRTPIAFVHLHGFSASRQETAPLAEKVAARFKANLFEARFTGHGRPGEALGRAKAEDWVRDAREAIAIGQVLGDRVVVIGVSTGATVGLLLAANDQPDVAAYVMLSPNLGPKDASAGLLLWPWASKWVPLVAGSERSWTPENEAHGKYWTTRYPIDALFSMMATVERARTIDLSTVKTPVLFIHAEDDPVVDAMGVEAGFTRLTSAEPRDRQLVDGPGDLHVLAGDILSPERTADIQRRVVEFLNRTGIESE